MNHQHPTLDLITVDKSWIDLVVTLPTLPRNDQKVVGKSLGRQPGGMGGNVACAASRLGLRTGMVSWVGDDADGQQVLADLQRYGVDTTHVAVEPGTTTNQTIVLIDSTGEKAIVIVPTAFNILNLDSRLTEYLGQADLVYCTAYDPDQLAAVAEVVHRSGGRITTDIESAAGLKTDTFYRTLALVDIAFVDAGPLETDDYGRMAGELLAVGPELIVMTFGARGSLACNAHRLVRCPAFEAPVVDTTGAGDCFTAAFLTAYARRHPLDQALSFASAAAALSIQEFGPRGALPTAEQVQAFLRVLGKYQPPND